MWNRAPQWFCVVPLRFVPWPCAIPIGLLSSRYRPMKLSRNESQLSGIALDAKKCAVHGS